MSVSRSHRLPPRFSSSGVAHLHSATLSPRAPSGLDCLAMTEAAPGHFFFFFSRNVMHKVAVVLILPHRTVCLGFFSPPRGFLASIAKTFCIQGPAPLASLARTPPSSKANVLSLPKLKRRSSLSSPLH